MLESGHPLQLSRFQLSPLSSTLFPYSPASSSQASLANSVLSVNSVVETRFIVSALFEIFAVEMFHRTRLPK
jgi:hypothetical protein